MVQLKDRNRAKVLMLGFNEAIHQLTTVNNVYRYGDALRMERWSFLVKGIGLMVPNVFALCPT